MTLKIPLKTYLDNGHELVEGDTLLCPCYPYIGEFVKGHEDDEFLIRMIGEDTVYKVEAEHLFDIGQVYLPIKIQRFHILDATDEDVKNL